MRPVLRLPLLIRQWRKRPPDPPDPPWFPTPQDIHQSDAITPACRRRPSIASILPKTPPSTVILLPNNPIPPASRASLLVISPARLFLHMMTPSVASRKHNAALNAVAVTGGANHHGSRRRKSHRPLPPTPTPKVHRNGPPMTPADLPQQPFSPKMPMNTVHYLPFTNHYSPNTRSGPPFQKTLLSTWRPPWSTIISSHTLTTNRTTQQTP